MLDREQIENWNWEPPTKTDQRKEIPRKNSSLISRLIV